MRLRIYQPTPKHFKKMMLSLQSQVKNLTAEKLHLIEQFRLAQQQRFGVSSEGHPAQGDLSGSISKQSLADKTDDVVGLKDETKTSGNGVLRNFAKKMPGDVAISGETGTTANWTESENSSYSSNVNQVQISQYLEQYRQAEDKQEAFDQLRENFLEFIQKDAVDSKNSFQVDQIDPRSYTEQFMDYAEDVGSDISNLFSSGDVDR